MTPGLIFDMDETLYPERQFIRSGFRAAAVDVERRYGVPADAAFNTLLRTLRSGGRRHALQTLCASFGVPASAVPELVEVIRRHQPTLRLPNSSVAVLTRARAEGWRLGVLTNGLPDVQARKVRALGLDNLVDAVVYAQEWGSGKGKPERESFDVIRARLDTPPAVTVFVGDDPWCDIVGARGAGLHTILLRRSAELRSTTGADRVVTTLENVLTAAADLVCREMADAA
jgi:putative hydrolase of the HAD superfamily